MRNGSGASSNLEIQARINRDARQREQRRQEVVAEVRAGRMTLQQAENKMNDR